MDFRYLEMVLDILILFMYSYQAEELATHLAISITFIMNLSKNE